jgi:hypothetical protein
MLAISEDLSLLEKSGAHPEVYSATHQAAILWLLWRRVQRLCAREEFAGAAATWLATLVL